MRISLVTETYFPQINGVSRTLGQLVRVLEQSGDTVQLIHPDYRQPPHQPHDHLVPSIRPPFYPELHLPRPPFGHVRRALDAFRPDLVHVATEATLGLAILNHARRRGIPVVSSFHTNFDQYAGHYRVGFVRAAVHRYLRWFHNRTLETYVPSRATIAGLEAEGYRNLVLWPRGVDGSMFSPDRPGRARVRQACGFTPDHVVVGHVSRIAAEKNVEHLGQALRLLLDRSSLARVLVVGDGPARPDLEALLGPAACFAGYRKGDDLCDHYAAADLFAFASLTETFGNVVIEAMASGLPVVAIRSGGPADTVRDSDTGFLVDPDQPPAIFADRLARLVDDPALRLRMAASARSYACSQHWDTIMLALRARYEAIVHRQETPAPRQLS